MAANAEDNDQTGEAGQNSKKQAMNHPQLFRSSENTELKNKCQDALQPRHHPGAHAGSKMIYGTLVRGTAGLKCQRGCIARDNNHQDCKAQGDYCERHAKQSEPSDI